MSSQNKINKSKNNMGVGLKNTVEDMKLKRLMFYTASDRRASKRMAEREKQEYDKWEDFWDD